MILKQPRSPVADQPPLTPAGDQRITTPSRSLEDSGAHQPDTGPSPRPPSPLLAAPSGSSRLASCLNLPEDLLRKLPCHHACTAMSPESPSIEVDNGDEDAAKFETPHDKKPKPLYWQLLSLLRRLWRSEGHPRGFNSVHAPTLPGQDEVPALNNRSLESALGLDPGGMYVSLAQPAGPPLSAVNESDDGEGMAEALASSICLRNLMKERGFDWHTMHHPTTQDVVDVDEDREGTHVASLAHSDHHSSSAMDESDDEGMAEALASSICLRKIMEEEGLDWHAINRTQY